MRARVKRAASKNDLWSIRGNNNNDTRSSVRFITRNKEERDTHFLSEKDILLFYDPVALGKKPPRGMKVAVRARRGRGRPVSRCPTIEGIKHPRQTVEIVLRRDDGLAATGSTFGCFIVLTVGGGRSSTGGVGAGSNMIYNVSEHAHIWRNRPGPPKQKSPRKTRATPLVEITPFCRGTKKDTLFCFASNRKNIARGKIKGGQKDFGVKKHPQRFVCEESTVDFYAQTPHGPTYRDRLSLVAFLSRGFFCTNGNDSIQTTDGDRQRNGKQLARVHRHAIFPSTRSCARASKGRTQQGLPKRGSMIGFFPPFLAHIFLSLFHCVCAGPRRFGKGDNVRK